MEIRKVRNEGRTKTVTVPKTCNIKAGDYVKIIKIDNKDKNKVNTGDTPLQNEPPKL